MTEIDLFSFTVTVRVDYIPNRGHKSNYGLDFDELRPQNLSNVTEMSMEIDGYRGYE